MTTLLYLTLSYPKLSAEVVPIAHPNVTERHKNVLDVLVNYKRGWRFKQLDWSQSIEAQYVL